MKNEDKKLIVKVLLIGIILFCISQLIPILFAMVLVQLFEMLPWLGLLISQILLLVLSIMAIVLIGDRKFSEHGFKTPEKVNNSKFIFLGIMAGMIATLTILFLGASGNPNVTEFSLLEIILLIWILASISEEIFTRGLILSQLEPLKDKNFAIFNIEIGVPVMISALFFCSMHFILFSAGADVITVIVIVIFTFFLGLFAGHQRSKSGSILPAIYVHSFGNIGGIIAGIIFNIIVMIIT